MWRPSLRTHQHIRAGRKILEILNLLVWDAGQRVNSRLVNLPFSCPLCYHNNVDSNRKRLLVYLLLNVLVSVCATTSVLFIYDRYRRNSAPQTFENPPSPASMAALEPANMEISTVVGAGIPSSEMVVLRNAGEPQAKLDGWKLQDEDSNVYTFGNLTLPPGGAVQLHTAPGKDTLIDRYWGLTASAWRSGETVTLLDAAGSVRSVYKVP